MEVIQSNKGGLKLCHDGFLYTKKAKSKNTIRWECTNRRSLTCKGAISTNHDVNVILSTNDHNHDQRADAVKVAKLRSEIKTNAKEKLKQTKY